MTEEVQRHFTGIIIGDAIVEKTSLREKLGEIQALDITHTGPFELLIHEMKIKKQTTRIRLWTIDSSSESWETIRGTYYSNASGAIIVFDTREENWIDELKFWIKEIKRANSKITMVLVHNLIDKEENDSEQIREIITEKIFKRYKYKFSFVELKEITDYKIEEIYVKLCEKNFEKQEKTT